MVLRPAHPRRIFVQQPQAREWSCACRAGSRRCPSITSTYCRVSVAMPDRCCSVFSADRSAASIARALPSRRISTRSGVDASPSLDELLDPHVAVQRAEESDRNVQPGDGDRLAAIHLRGEAGVGVDRRRGGDVAARAHVLGKHAPDEVVHVELRDQATAMPPPLSDRALAVRLVRRARRASFFRRPADAPVVALPLDMSGADARTRTCRPSRPAGSA